MTKKIIYKHLHLKLPEEDHKKLNALAVEKDKSITELTIQIISEYLGSNLQKKSDLQDINLDKIVQQYQELSDRLTALENKDNQLEKLEDRVVMMEKLMDAIQRQITVRDYAGKLPAHLIAEADDFDDEPDEILTDFLD